MEDSPSLTESVNTAYETRNRAEFKVLIEVLTIAFADSIPDLRTRISEVLKEDEKAAGLLSSVHYMLTQDFGLVRELPYGGLGITLTSSPKKLLFFDNQLHFASLSGSALREVELRGNAFYRGLATGNSLWNARCFNDSGAYAEYRNQALRYSINKDRAHAHCNIFDSVAMYSRNRNEAFSNPEHISAHASHFIKVKIKN